MTAQVLVLAKAPRPGHVKTRLCPPCTPAQAAAVARAALRDTLDAVDDAPVAGRCLVLAGESTVDGAWSRPGWRRFAQRGDGLGERIARAFADTAVHGTATVLIGMDTPQVSGDVLAACVRQLRDADAVLGPAHDGGWWLLGLRNPAHARFVATVPTSRPDTGERTHAALARAGLTVTTAAVMSDVDTAVDAWRVAALCRPGARFPASVARNVARVVGATA